MRKIFLIHSFFFLVVVFFTQQIWPDILLLLAQLIYVPVIFLALIDQESIFKKWYPFIAAPAYIAVGIMMVFPSEWNGVLSLIYLLFTFYIAGYGLKRFFRRGFIRIEEFVIDCGFIFLAVGGMWFVAYEFGMDTGFSPLITWLTAIHFHYSAFLMLTFLGLLGRLGKYKLYPYIASFMIVLPWVMAVGISLSRWVELIGIFLYVVTVFVIIVYSIKVTYRHRLQHIFIVTSFSAVGLTIIFACLYVFSHSFSFHIVTIEWMLFFHGITNAILFGLLGCLGWLISIPQSSWIEPDFPLSPIRKKFIPETTRNHLTCLVDDMTIYEPFIRRESVAKTILDFYEHTIDYELRAKVYWQTWFKPFAFVYRQMSRFLKQINLPLSSQQVKMTGDIYPIDEGANGRQSVRAWVRKIKGETVFVALYSFHTDGVRTYMNIALPLPYTSMHGILAFNQHDENVELTSERKDETMKDAGIYLIIGKNGRFRLPLSETFDLKEIKQDRLEATHRMNICGIRFLTIHYTINKIINPN